MKADESTEHYFSRSPAGPAQERTVTVSLAGQDVEVLTADGVFSGDGLDLGTRVLFREAPLPPPAGDLVDLGCGWGPIALTLALRSPGARVWAVDVNERAVQLTARNAARLGLKNVTACRPDQVPAGVQAAALWSNPPIRIGKSALHELLETWLSRLAPGATGHLVVQRHLGADSLHRWLAETLPAGFTVARAGSAKGFRVLSVARTS